MQPQCLAYRSLLDQPQRENGEVEAPQTKTINDNTNIQRRNVSYMTAMIGGVPKRRAVVTPRPKQITDRDFPALSPRPLLNKQKLVSNTNNNTEDERTLPPEEIELLNVVWKTKTLTHEDRQIRPKLMKIDSQSEQIALRTPTCSIIYFKSLECIIIT